MSTLRSVITNIMTECTVHFCLNLAGCGRAADLKHDDPRLADCSEHLRTLVQCCGSQKMLRADDPSRAWSTSLDG